MTDADHKRAQARERQRRHRERQRRDKEREDLYEGKLGVGYFITQRFMPADVLDTIAKAHPVIAAAREAGDEELGRMLDALEAAHARGELVAFDEDPDPC